ncbi:MAG TPA: hypothetical protein DCX01_09315 [Bacteroidetes bacterium]|nr:hypothetical protein [Bacteroidota bacterium]
MRKIIKQLTICLATFTFLSCNHTKSNIEEKANTTEISETALSKSEDDENKVIEDVNTEIADGSIGEESTPIKEVTSTPKPFKSIVKKEIKKVPVIDEQAQKDGSRSSPYFFNLASAFFQKNVFNGKVNYTEIKAKPTELNKLITAFENHKVSRRNSSEYKAFYINAYNLLTIKSLVDNYPTKSPLDIDGFFKVKRHKVAGEMLTLDQIENVKLRKEFDDARIHFVVVCGALSCPPIINRAYLPSTVDAQMTKQAKSAVNSDIFVKVDDSAKEVAVSMIMKWYKEDFVKENQTIIDYLNTYRNTQIPLDYNVAYQEYNWTINAQ